MDAEEVIRAFVLIRNEADALKKQHKEELDPLNRKMEACEKWLKRELNRMKVDSITKHGTGTAFFKRRVNLSMTGNWEVTYQYLKDNGLEYMLEHRLSKKAVEAYVEETGDLPPGVKLETTRVVQINKRPAKAK